MKKFKKFNLSKFSVDVVEFMFVKWLDCQGTLSVYKANCERFSTSRQTFQDDLRDRICSLVDSSVYSFDDLITLSFPFCMTSEGTDFWVKQSSAWRRFCSEFKYKF